MSENAIVASAGAGEMHPLVQMVDLEAATVAVVQAVADAIETA